MIRATLYIFAFIFLTACSSTIPLQTNDRFYGSTLRVNQPYELPGNLLVMGYIIPAGNYKALMKDNNGIYFSSSQPLIGRDPIFGTLNYTGGLYYKMTDKQVFYYVVNTRGFGELHKSSRALDGLKYQIVQ